MARYKKPLPGLTVVVSTRVIQPDYVRHIQETSGLKDMEVLIENNPDGEGLASVYNRLAARAQYDHVVFMHDDLRMETQGWGVRLLHHFQTTDYDIIGLAGVRKELHHQGCWWREPKNMVGIVNHEVNGKTHVSAFSSDQGQRVEPVIILDGLFIACNWKLVTYKWDESIPGFHFYDLGFTFPNYLEGHNIGVVTNIRVTHKSVGETNQAWEDTRKVFIEKYKDELPCIQ